MEIVLALFGVATVLPFIVTAVMAFKQESGGKKKNIK